MKRVRRPPWSFVVMRGADKNVKQFSISKRSVLAAPVAAIVAVAGCIAGLQMKAAYELRQLENQLEEQSAQYTRTIAGMKETVSEKDDAIVSLQQDLLELSRQAQSMKDKMSELDVLESKLKAFIEKYGTNDMPAGSGIAGGKSESSATNSLEDGVNWGTTSPRVQALSTTVNGNRRTAVPLSATEQSIYRMSTLARNATVDLKALSEMVDAMESSMEQTLRLAQNKRKVVDAYPSYWPTKSKQLTSGFGYRRDPFTGRTAFHAGIDINGSSGDAVFSAADGTVSESGYDSQLGKYIIIDHLGGLQTVYMHLLQIEAREGDVVVRGEKIGLLGSSGRSTGSHLHFQIMQKNEPVNPLPYFAQNN
ncbi:M23 family metallopeptidase [Paenibacillus sp. HB172176]|uniref:M23 family metallopeptidase n=1 Tax=Paenibacillus sp. HB172176 TaxID=2493690 RepID=UPI00143A22B0|nr:M23 family metallopeptidase [Paenibacillus sp. HB172176]